MVKWDVVLVGKDASHKEEERVKGKEKDTVQLLLCIIVWSRYTFHEKKRANRLDSHDPMTPCRPSRRRLTNKQEHDITLPHAEWLPLRFSAAGRGSFDKIKSRCPQRGLQGMDSHLGRMEP